MIQAAGGRSRLQHLQSHTVGGAIMGLRDNTRTPFSRRREVRRQRAGTRRQALLHRQREDRGEKNEIWTAIKTIPEWRDEMSSPTSRSPAVRRGRRGGAGKTYTVKAGDTLSAIAKAASGQRERLHEDLRGEPRSAERSGQDQAGTGAEDSGLAATPVPGSGASGARPRDVLSEAIAQRAPQACSATAPASRRASTMLAQRGRDHR